MGRAPADLTWLALEPPITGRTHQLRVHCAAMGWPIVGDTIYGKAPRIGGPMLHLHAREVVVPISEEPANRTVTAPVPAHMQAAAEGLRVGLELGACGLPSRKSKPRSVPARHDR